MLFQRAVAGVESRRHYPKSMLKKLCDRATTFGPWIRPDAVLSHNDECHENENKSNSQLIDQILEMEENCYQLYRATTS